MKAIFGISGLSFRKFVAAFSMLILGAVVMAGSALAQGAAPAEMTTRAKQAILMDANTGAVLFQHNADELAPPASMSKLMTLAVIFRALKEGRLKPEDEILFSVNAWRTGGAPSGTSAMFVPVNTKERLDEVLKGIIIQSGNDACIAVAESMAGTEAAFAKMMTDEARRIGLSKSTFRNSTGLHDPEHLMTARELAVLARHLIKEYPEHYTLFGEREFRYRKHRFFNRNPLLALDLGVDGLKTGYIKEAGYGLVASAKQDGRRVILVINGMEDAQARRNEAVRLIEWGFKGFADFKLFDAEEVVGRARVWGGDRMFVPLVGGGEITVLLPKAQSAQRLQAQIIYNSPLKAPIKKGDVIAKLRVTTASQSVNEVPLHAAEDVPQAGAMRRGLDTLVHMAFGWVLR
ncbi:D-alanyl-D-alanine carboxypeptidase family protein [Hyphomicrobium sp. CS1BSMeth3]|uniref:D-alanyl-D-alanine carboxypeptidase family protein n=1 Tax=Hyphomicrobium sp. CS1BSMeth3 TaxID=1892844 RepID=UPI0009314EA0|nr:D-alanyl-D-alanine carboxypeptidase family protein [Hyphomicrobium sp. CS1BSMeth3]